MQKKSDVKKCRMTVSKKISVVWLAIEDAALFMGIGIWRGEMAEVFLKSTNICLECIGIG